MARFESLLGQFGLQDRLVLPSDVKGLDTNQAINWNDINVRRETLKKDAFKFINQSLIV